MIPGFAALLLTVLITFLPPATAAAQEAQPRPESRYQQLFPNPTGLNGCEDLALAGELASQSKPLQDAMKTEATLSQKRAALEDPAVQRALSLVKRGLSKPFEMPAILPGPREEAAFSGFSLLRSVGRLLALQEFVQLADGQVSQAIDTLRDGLRIGYNLQSAAIIGSLVGVAIDSVVLRQIADHLEQLSARDCDRLLALANEWIAAPDPGIASLRAEKQVAALHLPDVPQRAAVATMYGLAIDRMIADLRRPAWERADPPEPPETSDAAAALLFKGLWETSRPAYARVLDRWTRELAEIQMLGIHAAIRRFRWEYGRPPGGLTDLKLGRLTVDPFIGKPIAYRVKPDGGYELSCAGPLPRDDEGRASTGERTPVVFPSRPRPPGE